MTKYEKTTRRLRIAIVLTFLAIIAFDVALIVQDVRHIWTVIGTTSVLALYVGAAVRRDRRDQQRHDRYREAAADSFSDYAKGLTALAEGRNPFLD